MIPNEIKIPEYNVIDEEKDSLIVQEAKKVAQEKQKTESTDIDESRD